MTKSLNGQKFTKGAPIRFEMEFKAALEENSANQLTLTNALIEIEFYGSQADRAASSNRKLLLSSVADLNRTTNTAAIAKVTGMISGNVTTQWNKEVFYRCWITPTSGVAQGERISQESYEGSFVIRS